MKPDLIYTAFSFVKIMSDCLFCKIVQGTIPAKIIHRDDQVVAFHDINPQAPVHFLVVPVKHVSNLLEPAAVDGAMLSSVYRTVQKLTGESGLQNGFRVVANCGSDGGQTVSHLHFHVLGKRPMAWPPG